MNPNHRNWIYVLIALTVLNIGCWSAIFSITRLHAAGSELYFLNVGQGDSELIRTVAGNILIDGGRGKLTTLNELDKILSGSDRTIDILMVSHPQLDHLAGLIEVARRYNVRLAVMTGAEYPLAEYQTLKALLRANKVPILYAIRGEEIVLGPGRLMIFNPAYILRGKATNPNTINDTSIVAKFSADGAAALFTGDISAAKERALADLIGRIDILKVSHHGSKYSSDPEFLRKVRPKIAVIEVGKNPYGHPTAEALSRLAEVGARVFRTDLDGTITFQLKESKIQISKSK